MRSSNALPLVTLITPTFNQVNFVAATIESVLAQDYKDIEYIVLDDGSTDATPQILAQFSDRIAIERHENMGQATTLNRGWGKAKGKYLAYLSSDDLLDPSCISSMVAALESDPGLVCAFPNADLIDEYGRIIKKSVCRPFSLIDTVVLQECHIGPGAVFRKSAFDAVGGWRTDLKLAPDREFWMRLATEGGFHFDPRPLAQYRLHRASMSAQETSDEVSREYLKVLDIHYSGRPTTECVRRREEAYGRAYIILARNSFRSGRFSDGIRYYREACRLHRRLLKSSVNMSLLRTVISKPVRMVISKIRFSIEKGAVR